MANSVESFADLVEQKNIRYGFVKDSLAERTVKEGKFLREKTEEIKEKRYKNALITSMKDFFLMNENAFYSRTNLFLCFYFLYLWIFTYRFSFAVSSMVYVDKIA